jgi:hypothetical protein
VKGATELGADPAKAVAISIHAPVKGATIMLPKTQLDFLNFNSRAREGRDIAFLELPEDRLDFNSRAREGRDANNSVN